ncbi:GNAT family N-acetyltransferase [Burkholderia sp. 22PA0099]|uniref:GNAT family N-acetyltransferase n=1 Tax=Burkholderia sp. 22PA0099 TaxID=3237372 RepID=UPI0039C2C62C
MKLCVRQIRLVDKHLWRCAREAIPVQDALIVELSQGGHTGYGEASAFMTDSYNSSLDAMSGALRGVAPLLAQLDPLHPEQAWERLAQQLAGSPFVLAALDCALHDLRARLLGLPLWRALNVQDPSGTGSTYSIGLDTPAVMLDKLRERPGWSAYKIKLASPLDLDTLAALRAATDAPFLVDGNCGWNFDDTIAALPSLQRHGVVAIEQPFARDAWSAAEAFRQRSPIPVYADESFVNGDDLDACTRAFHGVNLKLMKAGGLTPGLRLLQQAKARGLRTMLGCMPESSAGVAVTAHLGALVDYLDIDSIALLAVDSGTSVALDEAGRLALPARTGSGFVPDDDSPAYVVRTISGEQVLPLRHRVLRPQQPIEACRYPEDDDPHVLHFGAFDGGQLVGIASLYRELPPEERVPRPLPPGQAWRLRGMASHPEKRGTGIGAALLRQILTFVACNDGAFVWCNARTTAEGFYLREGFRQYGPPYEMPDIGPHVFLGWTCR